MRHADLKYSVQNQNLMNTCCLCEHLCDAPHVVHFVWIFVYLHY